MKKLLSLSLCLFMLLSILSFGCNNTEKNDNFQKTDMSKYIEDNQVATIWGAPNTISIMKDVDIKLQCTFWGEEWLNNADKVYLEGIKGEVESAQVMITAKEDIKSFDLKASDLVLENGKGKINKENIEVLAEKYIEVTAPSSASNNASMFTGYYPDALVPINSYKARRENKISANENQGIWLNISIPSDAENGLYKAELDLILNSKIYKVPVSLYVYDVVMSSTIHAKTSFDIWFDQIGNFEEFEDDEGNFTEWNKIYYDFLVSKKLSPQCTQLNRQLLNVGQSVASLTKNVEEMVDLARNEKITLYKLPYAISSVKGLNEEDKNASTAVCDESMLIKVLTAMANKNIELINNGEDINLFEKAFFYFNSIIDEPSSSKLPAVKECDLRVTRAKKAVSDTLNDYPVLQASVLKIPHVVTTHLNEAFIGNEEEGGIQTWCCETQNWTSQAIKEIKERKENTERYSNGEDFWIYMTCNSNNPNPSLQLDDNLLSSRSIFWMNYKYDISATLYWNVCFYSKYDGTTKERNVWTDPNSWVNANGDGYLLYPGTRYGLSTPISTLRLESLREGVDDYEYLYMLDEALTKYNNIHSTNYTTNSLISNLYDKIFIDGTVKCKTNVSSFSNARKQLLKLLEAISNDSSDAQNLINNLAI